MKRRLTTDQLRHLRRLPADGTNRLKQAMDFLDLVQQDVADGTGLSQPYVSAVARNRFNSITVENAAKFAEFFGCAIEDLFPVRQEMAS